MLTIPELAAEALGSHLAEHLDRRFGSTDAGLIERVQSAARLALDCIGNSDANHRRCRRQPQRNLRLRGRHHERPIQND
jgi:hypothetical protein